MNPALPNSRFEAALAAKDPTAALAQLAQDLKREGMSQREMYDLFTHYLLKHNGDEDPLCEPISSTMDSISGWCSGFGLFGTLLGKGSRHDVR